MSTAFLCAEVGNILEKGRMVDFCPTFGLVSDGFPVCDQSKEPQRQREIAVKFDAGTRVPDFARTLNVQSIMEPMVYGDRFLQRPIQRPRFC